MVRVRFFKQPTDGAVHAAMCRIVPLTKTSCVYAKKPIHDMPNDKCVAIFTETNITEEKRIRRSAGVEFFFTLSLSICVLVVIEIINFDKNLRVILLFLCETKKRQLHKVGI